MAVTQNSSAPYTAGATVINVIRRFRDRGLTFPLGKDSLIRAGVSESLVPRTLHALQTLELIDENGGATPTLEKIRLAPESEYKRTLADWLRTVYAEVFTFVDPKEDNLTHIRDAFRAYVPIGQQDRMVALFTALCVEAGLMEESQKDARATPRKQSVRARAAPSARNQKPTSRSPAEHAPQDRHHNNVALPPALAGLLQSIPADGQGWTKETREKFMSTFGSVLDFVIPIVTNDAREEEEGST